MKKIFFILFAAVFGSSVLALPTLSGQDLASGKNVEWIPGREMSVIVFVSPHCPCSLSHESSLVELASRFSKIRFLGVVSGANVKVAEDHFKERRLGFPVIAESGHEWADAFGALNTPHAFVVDRQGVVVFRGGVDNSRDASRADRLFLKQALEDLEQSKPIRVAASRPLGCAIRR